MDKNIKKNSNIFKNLEERSKKTNIIDENIEKKKNNKKNKISLCLIKKKKLKKKIIKIKKKFKKVKEAFLRARAEIENNSKRFQNEIKKIYKYSIYKFAKSLLPIRDSLESSLKINISSIEVLKSGINLTLKQLSNIFDKNSFIEISPKIGECLDPMKHQAISIIISEQENNTIVDVLQKGYMLYDRLLRPALVIVAKKKE
ncbi:nucleotide exchange factor GrpE [Candidatus Zinderia endosymbiont of Aphrophora alni]|uniref:nucleotide exchange factor GrpE n=1 Tax=Candidatus Zinderia endosymbiont of Aphrophora alni TaxID=3077951 RepID=UPI0030D49461